MSSLPESMLKIFNDQECAGFRRQSCSRGWLQRECRFDLRDWQWWSLFLWGWHLCQRWHFQTRSSDPVPKCLESKQTSWGTPWPSWNSHRQAWSEEWSWTSAQETWPVIRYATCTNCSWSRTDPRSSSRARISILAHLCPCTWTVDYFAILLRMEKLHAKEKLLLKLCFTSFWAPNCFSHAQKRGKTKKFMLRKGWKNHDK